MESRQATHADLDGVVRTLAAAFENDPVWGWALPGPRAQLEWWRLLAGSALRYPNTWIIGDCEAVAVWLPPGGVELTDEEAATVQPLLIELLGDRATEVSDLMGLFDSTHPSDPPHYYLSLLGTHPENRGRGLGMALLDECLARIDAERQPAYLESSNPSNDPRYEARGFRRVGSFETPGGGHVLSKMWRDSPGDR